MERPFYSIASGHAGAPTVFCRSGSKGIYPGPFNKKRSALFVTWPTSINPSDSQYLPIVPNSILQLRQFNHPSLPLVLFLGHPDQSSPHEASLPLARPAQVGQHRKSGPLTEASSRASGLEPLPNAIAGPIQKMLSHRPAMACSKSSWRLSLKEHQLHDIHSLECGQRPSSNTRHLSGECLPCDDVEVPQPQPQCLLRQLCDQFRIHFSGLTWRKHVWDS